MHDEISSRPAAPGDLIAARVLTLAPVVLAFPIGIAAVFSAGAGRNATADQIAWAYSLGLFAAFSTAFWPLPGLRGWTFERRALSAAFLFMVVSYATHLSWELGWLLLHERMPDLRDTPWAYVWWAYIDGGDLRYATAPTELLAIELLSVANGALGVTGVALWIRSRGRDERAVLLFMATAVVHLYSTSYYFLSEAIPGFPNVDTSSFTDSYIKFGLANAPWLTMPWLVLWWGQRALRRRMHRGPCCRPTERSGSARTPDDS
jgi:hypothetical protein